VSLHASNPATPYLSLAARLGRFVPAHLDEPLYETRILMRVRCMRQTVFVLPANLAPHAIAATHRHIAAGSERYMVRAGITRSEYEGWRDRILAVLGRERLNAKEIRARLAAPKSLSPIINLMCDETLLLRDRPAAGWRDPQHTYVAAGGILPRPDWSQIDEPEADKVIVQEYVRAFGPVTADDVAWWTGFARGRVAAALRVFGPELVRVAMPPAETEYLMLTPEFARASEGGPSPDPAPAAATAASAAGPTRPGGAAYLLPSLDCYVMGYHQREHYISGAWTDYAFDRAGNSTSVVIQGGEIVGVWDALSEPEPALGVFLFADRTADGTIAALQSSAARIAGLLFGGEVPIRRVAAMRPLTRRPAGWVLKPLHESAAKGG
jgi:hypothetical protein